MLTKADAFVALPGGPGTLDEVFEEVTNIQLRVHEKPLVMLDINGFWGPQLEMLDRMRSQGFIRPDREFKHLLGVVSTVPEVLPALAMLSRGAVGEKIISTAQTRIAS